MLWTTSHYSALAPGRRVSQSAVWGGFLFTQRPRGRNTGCKRRATSKHTVSAHEGAQCAAEARGSRARRSFRVPGQHQAPRARAGPGPVPAPRVTPRAGALCVVLTLFLFTYASPVCQRRGDCFSAWLMRAPPVPVQPRACHFMLCDLSVRLLAVAQKHEIALTLTSRTRAARGRQRRELRAPGSAARGLRESAAEPRARGRPAQKQALEGDGAGILGSARRGGAGHGPAGRPGQAGFRGRPFQGLTARLAGHVLGATCQFPWLRRKVMRGKSRSRAGGLAASPGAEGTSPAGGRPRRGRAEAGA